jgi:hypothetical protein
VKEFDEFNEEIFVAEQNFNANFFQNPEDNMETFKQTDPDYWAD